MPDPDREKTHEDPRDYTTEFEASLDEALRDSIQEDMDREDGE
jgi:hypothetical protein